MGNRQDRIKFLTCNFFQRNQTIVGKIYLQEKLKSLASSIKEVGLLEPIVVRKIGDKHELVRALSITPDGQLAISSNGSTLKVWNLAQGKAIASFTGDGALAACGIAPDGKTIVAGETSGRVHFLRLEGLD